jgi:hypothetical protein
MRQPTRTHPRALAALVAGLLLAAAITPTTAIAADAVVQPVSGLPFPDLTFMGAATAGAPGELWGYTADGFVHRTDADGWRFVGPPLGADGQPLVPAAFELFERDSKLGEVDPGRGPQAPGSGRVTPRGGFAVAARDVSDPSFPEAMIVVRDPGDAPRVLPQPAVRDTTHPDAPLQQGEQLAISTRTPLRAPRVALAAVDEGEHTGVFVGPQTAGGFSDPTTDGILHWDGEQWRREPIDPPAGFFSSGFQILALGASSLDNAWMLGAFARDGDGVELFHRVVQPDGPHWQLVELDSPFAHDHFPLDEAPADAALAGVTGGAYPAQSLTVTPQRVWIDGHYGSGTRDFTLHYDVAAGRITGSWCDGGLHGEPALCDHPLGLSFGASANRAQLLSLTPAGTLSDYRSFAWDDGSPFGRRVITNVGYGTFARLEGETFVRQSGTGSDDAGAYGSLSGSNDPWPGHTTRGADAAFTSDSDGWLGGSPPARVTTAPEAPALSPEPLPARRPLTAAAPAPAATPAADGSAIAVGLGGTILRRGAERWTLEFAVDPETGRRATPDLRAAAWSEPGYAYAVGDDGAMWTWIGRLQRWVPDDGRPDGLLADLHGIAFAPGDPARGYAVGADDTLLRYDKAWTPDALPAGFEHADLLAIDFAGATPLVVARRTGAGGAPVSDVLFGDAAGRWHVDEQLHVLLAATPGTTLTAIDGLADGGVVAAGRNFVALRDAGGAWQVQERAPRGVEPIAVAGFREGGALRALLSVDDRPPAAAGAPPRAVPFAGLLLRETASGEFHDEQHLAFHDASTRSPAFVPDPILSLALVDGDGHGELVGGQELPAATAEDRTASQTAAIYHYPAAATAADELAASPVPLPDGPLRLLVGGGAECGQGCALNPQIHSEGDVMLTQALTLAGALHARPDGPAALLYTGSRGDTSRYPFPDQPSVEAIPFFDAAQGARFAALTAGAQIPFFPAAGAGDRARDGGDPVRAAFAGFPAPLGAGAPPAGITTDGIPAPPASGGGGARTQYAFDVHGDDGGVVRVIVLDGSSEDWLRAVLADARADGVPAIAVSSFSLNGPGLGDDGSGQAVPGSTEGDRIAHILLDGGASAHFFSTYGGNRRFSIPTGVANGIASYGTGSLNYGLPASRFTGLRHDNSGLLLTEVDWRHRDPRTNRAPVSVRLIPVVEDLALDPVDGTELQRSRPALFRALARRPRAGHEPGTDPYLPIPPTQPCPGTVGCATRVAPEFTFASSDPDIGDFVARDPNNPDPRAVLLGSDGKPLPDPASGLFCAFNAGTTTVSVRTGGLAYSLPVTIARGAAARPCGTVPLSPSRFPPAQTIVRASASTGADIPAQSPGQPPQPAAAPSLPAPIPVPPASAPVPPPHAPPSASPPALPPLAVPLAAAVALLPPRPPTLTPTPPSGQAPVQVSAFSNVPATREERDEEYAPDEVRNSAVRYSPPKGPPLTAIALLAIVLAGATGATVRRALPRGRPRPARATVPPPSRPTRRP